MISLLLALNLKIFVGNGPFAITPEQAMFVSGKIQRVMQVEFPRLRPVNHSLAEIFDPLSPRYYVLDESTRAFTIRNWAERFTKWGYGRSEPILLLTQPLIDGDALYTAGMAINRCAIGRQVPVALANVTAANMFGQSRLVHAAYAGLHELLHLLGAKHEDRAGSVMLANPLPSLVETRKKPLRVTQNTKKQVRLCLEKNL